MDSSDLSDFNIRAKHRKGLIQLIGLIRLIGQTIILCFFMLEFIQIKQSSNRALLGEESPCIQGQTAGETPDGVSRWIGLQEKYCRWA